MNDETCELHGGTVRNDKGELVCCLQEAWWDEPVPPPKRFNPPPPGIREQVAGSLRVKETEPK